MSRFLIHLQSVKALSQDDSIVLENAQIGSLVFERVVGSLCTSITQDDYGRSAMATPTIAASDDLELDECKISPIDESSVEQVPLSHTTPKQGSVGMRMV